MERIKVYFEAFSFLASGLWNKNKELMESNSYFFAFIGVIFFTTMGFVLMYMPILFLVFTIVLFATNFSDTDIMDNLFMSFIFFVISFIFSFATLLFYDYDYENKSAAISISHPAFEVTSDRNVVFEKSNPKELIYLDDDEFVFLKNTDCNKIEKIRTVSGYANIGSAFEDVSYGIVCDGKEI